jgi:hypothetical protein
MPAIPVTPRIALHAYYDRASRMWHGYYLDRDSGNQIGDAWFDATRDGVLVLRPPTPKLPLDR